MTLASFILILRKCPYLYSLGFSIHATPVNPELLSGVGNVLVQEISAGSSTVVQAPAEVVRSLISVFPDLREVTFREAECPGWKKNFNSCWN